ENYINIEVLVNTLRQTKNFQTQQHVLLCLADCIVINQDQMLHNIVSIFTFMGDSLLQKDDLYTSQVMTKLIDVILSAVRQLPENSKKVDEILLDVFRVFVDARKHISQHRLIPLFKQLVGFDLDECLWKLLVLVIESNVRRRDATIVDLKGATTDKQMQNVDLDIIAVLLSNYTVETQLKTMNKLVKFLDEFISILVKSDSSIAIVDSSIKNFPQLCRMLIFNLNKIILSAVADKDFIMEFLCNMDKEVSNKEIESLFKELVNRFIIYMLKITEQQKTNISEKIYEKYYFSLMKIIHNTLEKINYLMPAHLFVDVMESLLNHEQASAQCQALELINSKLLQLEHSLSLRKSFECGLKLVPLLIISLEKEKSKLDAIYLKYHKQLCFMNLKMLCRYYGPENMNEFELLPEVINKILIRQDEANPALIDSSLLCLVDLIPVQKNKFFPHLKPMMIPFMNLYNNNQILKSPISIQCVLMVISKLIQHLGHFLGPYLNNIVQMLCTVYTQDDIKHQYLDYLMKVLSMLAKNIDLRLFLPCIVKAYEELVNKNPRGLFILFKLFHDLMENATKETTNTYLKMITEVVFLFSSLRVDASVLKMNELMEIENIYTDSILSFVVHLSEVTFRPILLKFFNSLDDNVDRLVTFYHLIFKLSRKLKAIFNIFVSILIKQMADILVQHDTKLTGDDNVTECKTKLLVNFVLDTISECYLHDVDSSLSSGTGDALFKPLISQMENYSGNDSLYEETMTHLIPCIVQLMLSIKDNDQLFNLHKLICQQMKNSNSKVRMSAIRTIKDVASGMGCSYELLFPETAPYLAELLEDDSEDV
ncbi:hypothetical protein HELRODRAFT_130247, partial [Helobdella robusta]|uniref:HEAT repeat-containing protein 1 n=1 Tax=Helobdella robusta TaxID=6412 RepID=T1EHT5_HELRO